MQPPIDLERLKSELGQVVELMDDQLADKDQGEMRELLRRGEVGVAFEWLVACIAADAIPLSQGLYDRIQRAGHMMDLDRDLSEILGPFITEDREDALPLLEEALRPLDASDSDLPESKPPLILPGLPMYEPDDDDDEDDEDDELEEDDDEEELEDGPRYILITGACGNIGRKLRAAWDEVYDLVLLDVAAGPDDPEVLWADLSVLDDDWITHFHNVDTVIHLAGNPNEFSTWEQLQSPNLDVLSNVFHAAALAGVERLIFASSNHVMGDYRDFGDMPITTELPPRPDSPYGGTKLMGERLGQSLARAFDLSFVALRLGWIQHGENLPETLPDEWARAMWLSNGDLVRLFECAVEADLEDRTFLVANGMSGNSGMRWDLTPTAEILGFVPEDDAYAEEL